MILISNHVKTHKILPIPDDVVIRINMAWVKTEKELVKIIESVRQDIFLDFPQGRSKPPKPSLTLAVALKMLRKYKHITHFAVSNAESLKIISYLRSVVPSHIELVPKIETVIGVEQLASIIKKAKTKNKTFFKTNLFRQCEFRSGQLLRWTNTCVLRYQNKELIDRLMHFLIYKLQLKAPILRMNNNIN